VPYVEYFNLHPDNAVDHAVDVTAVATQQVSEFAVLRSDRASVRVFVQAEDLLFETLIPFPRSGRIHTVDFLIQMP
jgi:hypothetical protein